MAKQLPHPLVAFKPLRSPLFDARDVPALTAIVGSLRGSYTNETASQTLNACFMEAFAFGRRDEALPSPKDQLETYRRVVDATRSLGSELGISEDIDKLLSPPSHRDDLLWQQSPAIHAAAFWLRRGMDQLADDATSPLISVGRLGEIAGKVQSRDAIQDRMKVAVDRLERNKGKSLSDLEWKKVGDSVAIEGAISLVVPLLALVVGLAERGAIAPWPSFDKRPQYTHGFHRELVRCLAAAHFELFGYDPVLMNESREPGGSGVQWARAVLCLAASRIGAAFDADDDRDAARIVSHSVKQAAQWADSTIATRLRNGIKTQKSRAETRV